MTTKKVSEHALLVRINQKLEKRGEMMRRARPGAGTAGPGAYHLIDVSTNVPKHEGCDLAYWGHELGVLADDEEFVPGD